MAVGDISANLDALRQEDRPLEETTLQIWQLLRIGYSRHQLVSSVRLFLRCSWSSVAAEHGHASASLMMKAHGTYSKATMCSRALVHMMRFLFTTDVVAVAALARVAERIARLRSYKVRQYQGRQQFFKDALDTAYALAKARGTPTAHLKYTVMATHAEQYAKLPLQDQDKYEGRAQVMQTKRQLENNDLIAEARQKAARLQKRVAESKECPFRGFVLASCKLSDTDLEEFATIVNLSEFTVVRVGELRKLAMEAPPPPTLLQQARLASISLVRPVPVQKQPWLSTLCLHRDTFSQTALVWNTPAGSRYFAFIFAMKSPYLTCMRELVLAKKQVFVPQCVSRSSWESIDDSVQHGHNFIFQINNTITPIHTFQFKVKILALSFESCPSLVKLCAALPR